MNEYFELITAINKEPIFFNLSIKENLNIINNDFDKIVATCKSLGIHDTITKLKDGYDTILGQVTLNRETKSTLDFARLLLKNSKIMIIDETFANINTVDASDIIETLELLKRKHTIIIITRDINILEHADEVIFLNDGKIKKSGKHADLYHSNREYRKQLSS